MNYKKPLLIVAAATVATVGSLGAVGAVSAATDNSAAASSGTNPMSSLVEKIASKFNLNQDDVAAVFDEARSEREAEMKQERSDRISQAVTDGSLTQEQADYITAALAEIDSLRGDGNPEDENDTTREQIRTKMDTLRTWAEQQNLELRNIIGGPGHGHGGPGGFGGFHRMDASDSDNNSSNS